MTEAGGVNNGTPGIPIATGDLNSTDVDNPGDSWQAVAAGAATYGTYRLTAAGVWIYTLNNSNADGAGAQRRRSSTHRQLHGADRGRHRAAGDHHHPWHQRRRSDQRHHIGNGDSKPAAIANATPGIPTATGDLNSTDVDNLPDSWQAVAAGAATTNGYGSYALTRTGVWTYTLDNSNADGAGAQRRRDADRQLHGADRRRHRAAGDHHHLGANDAAVISGTTSGNVTEAGGVANGTPGMPTATGNLNSTDVDNPADSWQAVAAGAATYGSYALSATGVWTYTLNDNNPTVQALNVGDPPLTDSFTALTADGTAQLVTITIHGTDDAAVISGTTSGNVTEAGGVTNATPGIPIATGDLNSTDVDNLPDSWQAVAAGAATTNGYGSYALSRPGCGPTRSTTTMPTCRRSTAPRR